MKEMKDANSIGLIDLAVQMSRGKTGSAAYRASQKINAARWAKAAISSAYSYGSFQPTYGA
jgi:hypothetical protein